MQNEEIVLALSYSGALDPEGLCQDAEFLNEHDWSLGANGSDNAEWTASGGVLQLTLRPSGDNPHRVLWELGIMANGTKIGYASKVMRPGDINGERMQELIKEAVKAGEDEMKSWNDALAEARRALGI